MQKGITKEIIFKESEKIIKAKGLDKFSVRVLSANLGIKPASLYNHISGIEEIYEHLATKTTELMNKKLADAMRGKSPDEAFLAGADAYRKFAKTKREYYLIIVKIHSAKSEKMFETALKSVSPITDLIKTYNVSEATRVNYTIAFCSFLHGFIEAEHAGFLKGKKVSSDKTFEAAVKAFLVNLKGVAK